MYMLLCPIKGVFISRFPTIRQNATLPESEAKAKQKKQSKSVESGFQNQARAKAELVLGR
jgi:hypothetical protein